MSASGQPNDFVGGGGVVVCIVYDWVDGRFIHFFFSMLLLEIRKWWWQHIMRPQWDAIKIFLFQLLINCVKGKGIPAIKIKSNIIYKKKVNHNNNSSMPLNWIGERKQVSEGIYRTQAHAYIFLYTPFKFKSNRCPYILFVIFIYIYGVVIEILQ